MSARTPEPGDRPGRQPSWDSGRHPFRPPKLTAAQRSEITRRLAAGEKSADLAVEFGVHRSTINRHR